MTRDPALTWLREKQQTLWDCGVPLMVTDDIRRWRYFLEHGTYPGTPFSLSELDSSSARRLQTLAGEFVAHVPHETRPLLLADLERHAARSET